MSIKNLNCRFEDLGLFVAKARLCYDVISEKQKLSLQLEWTIKFVRNISLKSMMFTSLRSIKRMHILHFFTYKVAKYITHHILQFEEIAIIVIIFF